MEQTSILRFDNGPAPLRRRDRFVKRSFDVVCSFVGLCATGWLIGLAIIAARWSTRKSGIFRQRRVGMHGRNFEIFKIRTMADVAEIDTTVTTKDDPRITRLGRVLRKLKIDELPQLYNVLRGDMSLVGPRPDVPELMATLSVHDRIILTVRPGITGPASIKYRNEDELLGLQADPIAYNQFVIFPDKTRMNREYIESYRLLGDVEIILRTLFGGSELATPQSVGSLESERAA